MPTNQYCIRFFWGKRRASRENCAARLLKFLRGLEKLDPVFGENWYRAGDPPDNPKSKQIQLNAISLSEFLKSTVNKTDLYPRKPIRQLGYSPWLMSDGYDRVSLRVHCGAYTPWVSNSIILAMRNHGAAGRRVFRAITLKEIFRLVVRCWEPDIGQVWSIELSQIASEHFDDLQVGWLLYIAKKFGPFRFDSARIGKEQLGGYGTLLTATSQRLNCNSGRHMDRVRELAHSVADVIPAVRQTLTAHSANDCTT